MRGTGEIMYNMQARMSDRRVDSDGKKRYDLDKGKRGGVGMRRWTKLGTLLLVLSLLGSLLAACGSDSKSAVGSPSATQMTAASPSGAAEPSASASDAPAASSPDAASPSDSEAHGEEHEAEHSASPSANASASPSASASASPSASPSASGSATPDATPKSTQKPSAEPSATPKVTSEPSHSASPSTSPAASPSASVSASPEAEPSASSDDSEEEVIVEIKNFAYSPAKLTIKKGTTVVFINRDRAKHTATADGGEFDTGLLAQNESAKVRFNDEGTFSYYCAPHPNMVATIIVTKD